MAPQVWQLAHMHPVDSSTVHLEQLRVCCFIASRLPQIKRTHSPELLALFDIGTVGWACTSPVMA
jgi:hypothetical protein